MVVYGFSFLAFPLLHKKISLFSFSSFVVVFLMFDISFNDAHTSQYTTHNYIMCYANYNICKKKGAISLTAFEKYIHCLGDFAISIQVLICEAFGSVWDRNEIVLNGIWQSELILFSLYFGYSVRVAMVSEHRVILSVFLYLNR